MSFTPKKIELCPLNFFSTLSFNSSTIPLSINLSSYTKLENTNFCILNIENIVIIKVSKNKTPARITTKII